MLIRCDKCLAQFSLQDGVVRGARGEIPATFAVECGRCGATFQATTAASGNSVPPSRRTPAPTPSKSRAATSRASEANDAAGSAPTSATLARTLKPKRPDESADDDPYTRAMSERAARRKKVIAGVVVLAVIASAWLAVPLLRKRFGGIPAAAQTKLAKAQEKLLLDDAASLEAAADLDQQAARLAPGEARPEGERAFALMLLAGAHKDLADRAESRAKKIADAIVKQQAEKADGWEKRVAALIDQTKQLDSQREPHVRDANRLEQQGLSAAKAALEEDPDEPAALRAMGLYSAYGDAAERGARFVDKAAHANPTDGLTNYVRAQLWLCGSPSKEKQEQGLAQLALAREAQPHLLRALYDSAAIEVERQQFGPAREKLDKLLAANPAHERAQALRALIAAAP